MEKGQRGNNQAVLVPKKMADGRWQVSLGIEWEEGKKRNPRKQFSTRAAAQEFCNAERARRKAHGSITAEADGSKVAQWMVIDSMMEEWGIKISTIEDWIKLEGRLKDAKAGNLLTAGTNVLDAYLLIQRTGTAQQCFEEWHTALMTGRTMRRGSYRKNARSFCGHFLKGDSRKLPTEVQEKKWKGFGAGRDVLEITPEVIEAYVKYQPGYFSVISAWLGWASKNKWLPSNPCTGKNPESPVQVEVVTLTPTEARTMLRVAAESQQWDVLAHVAISLFAGLRPDEFRKVAKGDEPAFLFWKDVKKDHISVSPRLCKNGRRTGKGRTVPIESTLQAWLEFLKTKQGNFIGGKVVREGWVKGWKDWRKKYWLKSGEKWPKDVLRHSFGSYHLARGKDPAKTAFLMENSPKVLIKHYWAWETLTDEAEEFWALTPEIVLGGKN